MLLRILVLCTLLGIQGTNCSMKKGHSTFSHRYSNIPDGFGFNLKISDEVMDGFVDKLKADCDEEPECRDMDTKLFILHDDEDDFSQVDLTDWDSLEKDKTFEAVDLMDIKLDTEVYKRSFAYSRAVSILPNKTKSFFKLHQSSKESGKLSSTVTGSWNTTIKSHSTGKIDSGLNTTIFSKGSEHKSTLTASSTLDSSSTEKRADKRGCKATSASTTDVTVTVAVGNKTVSEKLNIQTKAETFRAPFRMYLTLFESVTKVSVSGTEAGSSTTRGEVNSRVVFARNGKSLTKGMVKGYVVPTTEKKDVGGLTMMNFRFHVWTKLVNKTESEIELDVHSYVKGREFSRVSVNGIKIFAGSGLGSFECSRVTIPIKGEEGNQIQEHEYGVQYITRSLIDGRMFEGSDGIPSDFMEF